MRVAALESLACPRCRATLELAPGVVVAAGRVAEGELVCRLRGCHYPVRGGVPVLRPAALVPAIEGVRAAEAAGAGAQLSAVGAEIVGRVVLACGLRAQDLPALVVLGPRALVVVASEASAPALFEAARDLTETHVVIGEPARPPVGPVFDVAVCVGVPPALPDPGAGLRGLAAAVRDRGRVILVVPPAPAEDRLAPWVAPARALLAGRLPAPALFVLRALYRAVARRLARPPAPAPVRQVGRWLAEGFRDARVSATRAGGVNAVAVVARPARDPAGAPSVAGGERPRRQIDPLEGA